MSHWRLISLRLRALLAAALVCALASTQFAAAASVHDASMASRFAGPAVTSPQCAAMGHIAHDGGARGEQHHRRSGSFGCPYCCLAAGSAVLPERVGVPIRIARVGVTRTVYLVLALREPENLVSPEVNGARAPPCPTFA